MKNFLSERVELLEESATLKMSRLGRELKAQGHNVISLSLGEPDFDTPNHVKEAAWQALRDGYTKYTPVNGLPELCEAVSAKFKRDNDLDYSPQQIVVSNGAKQSIYNLCQAVLNEGDEVVIFTPYWVSYYEIVKLSGGVPVPLYAGVEQDFKPTAEQLEAVLTEKTKFVLFSSPCNPTGSVFSRTELEEIAAVIANHPRAHIISDEIYEYINFTENHASIGAIDLVADRTITVNGFAKGFSMTGWRLGYMGAPKFIADACTKIQGQVTSGASSFGQKAAAVALMSDLEPTHAMRDAFLKRRDLVLGLLGQIEGMKTNKPQGAFYVFPDISAFFGKSDGENVIQNSDDFATFILQKAHVALVEGGAFGEPNCFRLSYAASEAQLREAIQRIADAVGTLK